MNPTLALSTFHRLLTRPLAVAVAAAYGLYAFFASLPFFQPGTDAGVALWLGQGCAVLVWVLGAGLIGSDVSSGSLALLLSRPLSRTRYLFSRWLGLVAAVLGMHLLLFALMLALHGVAQGQAPTLPDLANLVLGAVFITVCHASLLVLLSSCLPGIGDAAVYVGGFVLTGFALAGISNELDDFIAKLAQWVLLPGSEALLQAGKHQEAMAWSVAGTYLMVAAIQLWAATLILEQRDLSYVNR